MSCCCCCCRLLLLKLNTPALEPLLQLPPRLKKGLFEFTKLALSFQLYPCYIITSLLNPCISRFFALTFARTKNFTFVLVLYSIQIQKKFIFCSDNRLHITLLGRGEMSRRRRSRRKLLPKTNTPAPEPPSQPPPRTKKGARKFTKLA